ncbi:MAG: ATP-dependent DNA helicase RecG [Bacteroidetes bacterium]|nr:ATP-dependent DNA helicase RecG [Bacteroidota bacterium]
MAGYLDTPIEYLKGVGPQRAEALKNELDIHTIGDLLSHYPARHEDRSRIYTVAELQGADINVQLYGRIVPTGIVGVGAGRRFTARFQDTTGNLELVWFQGVNWIEKSLKPGEMYLVHGKLSQFNGKLNIAHPEIEHLPERPPVSGKGLVPVYPLSEGMRRRRLDNRFMVQCVNMALALPGYEIPENLPAALVQQQQLLARGEAVRWLHKPENITQLETARQRLKFEELFFLQVRHLQLKGNRQRTHKGLIFDKVGALFNTFYKEHLPFSLTEAQKRVLKEIRQDMKGEKQMNRLLQGDVGSGKTIVALLTMLLAADNGYQSCLMAPTEILASQHFYSLSELLQEMHIKPVLLTGGTRKKAREEILEQLKQGEIPMLIGTHALLEADVEFQNLGLVVIDEQHRFGVAQRAKLWHKGNHYPHVLVMTATPIPRTLAMTVYGDLDVSVIDQMPAGRKPIVTVHRHESNRPLIMDFLKKEIAAGRQIYYVFPLIEDSEKLDLKSLMGGYDMVADYLSPPDYTYSMVHGRMKPEEKDEEMRKFKLHRTDIMVATTVIEVGVNVPNATVMVIENAERFGLAQLHQLRGRVGRGGTQSYCILVTGSKLSENARKRLKTMVRTTDGFEISKVDLELRGPGDMDGTRQSGILELKLADIQKDENLLVLSRELAQQLLDRDPLLMLPENMPVRNELNKIPHRTVWSKIS